MASYNRRFVPRLSENAEPLIELVQKNRRFHWREQCQRTFQRLKTKYLPFRRSLFLMYPNQWFCKQTRVTWQWLCNQSVMVYKWNGSYTHNCAHVFVSSYGLWKIQRPGTRLCVSYKNFGCCVQIQANNSHRRQGKLAKFWSQEQEPAELLTTNPSVELNKSGELKMANFLSRPNLLLRRSSPSTWVCENMSTISVISVISVWEHVNRQCDQCNQCVRTC